MTNQIFTAQTSNANSVKFPSEGFVVSLIAKGTWGGATLTVQVSPDDGTTWVTSDVALTSDGIQNFTAGKGVFYRVALSGATGTTSLSAWIAYEK
jgi:hypothetical protein